MIHIQLHSLTRWRHHSFLDAVTWLDPDDRQNKPTDPLDSVIFVLKFVDEPYVRSVKNGIKHGEVTAQWELRSELSVLKFVVYTTDVI